MEALTAASAFTVVALAYVGRERWHRQRRRERHARPAMERMRLQSHVELAQLAERTQRLQARSEPAAHNHADVEADAPPVFGVDFISDFQLYVIASLQRWADEASEELESLHGRRLAARRRSLRGLRAEIRALCKEIEEREEAWARDRGP